MTTSSPPASSNRGFALVVVAIIMLGVLAVAFLVADRGSDEANPEQTAPIETIGDALVAMPAGVSVTDLTNDPAAGTVAPTLIATDFEGNEVTIEADGQAKAIYFLAHWCSHCQAEVPVVQQLIDDGQVPEGLDLYAVSTAVESGQGNYPPQSWLSGEGFEPTTVRDDATGSAFQAFGGSGFPYVVYLDGENKVVARSAGNMPGDAIVSLWESTVAG